MCSISIAMATYNGEKFLRQQLGTLAAQTTLPQELVVSDDSSTDGTLSIVEEFANSAPFRVRVLANRSRLGYKENFIQAANSCNGRLIAFCDQDDLWYPEKLRSIEPIFDDKDVYLCFHNASVSRTSSTTVESLISNEPLPWKQLSNVHSALYNPQGFTQVFRSELCAFSGLWSQSADHHKPTEPMAHDQWYFFLAQLLGRVEFLESCLATYRIHENNTLGWNTRLHSQYHRVRALVTPFATCSRKLLALEAMLHLLRQLSKSGALGVVANLRAELELRRLVDLMHLRVDMLTSDSLLSRLVAYRQFLRQSGYQATEKGGRASLDQTASDLLFIALGPRFERGTRRLAGRSGVVLKRDDGLDP